MKTITSVSAYDPHLSLVAEGIYYWQRVGGEGECWNNSKPEELRKILESENPVRYRAAHARLTDHKDEASYAGPIQFDFDGEIEEVLYMVQKEFIPKLKKLGVNPYACRWYLTGGRGVHVEIPQGCFMAEPGFVLNLPQIYKEIARELRVDTMDFRIYNLGRGRMWRVPNVERLDKEGKPTGAYKVPMDFDSFLTCTAENYDEYCSAPREFPPLAPATIAQGLADLFNKYRGEVASRGGAPRTWSAAEAEVRARWEGNAPPSLLDWLKGKVPSDAGWNEIAMQIALLALALGWDETRLVQECDGLIQNHCGDGKRYDTAYKRSKELISKHRYYDGDHKHGFTVPGLMSVLPPGVRDAVRIDLAGIVADAPEDQRTIEEILLGCDTLQERLDAALSIRKDRSRKESEFEAFCTRAAKASGVSAKTFISDVRAGEAAEDNRPVVVVKRGRLGEVVDAALRVMADIPTLRQRGGRLVEVTGATFKEVESARLKRLFTDVSRWTNSSNDIDPPKDAIDAIMQEPSWPVLEANNIAVQPTLTPSGEIGAPEDFHMQYDPADWPAYADGERMDEVIASVPTSCGDKGACIAYCEKFKDEIIETSLAAEDFDIEFDMGAYLRDQLRPAVALDELRGLVREVPFVSPTDESVAIAGMLTAAVRSALRTAPVFLVSAHSPGSGKTRLCEIIANFAMDAEGLDGFSWPDRREEQAKSLFSCLLGGGPVQFFDNIDRNLSSPVLCAVSTMPRYSARVLATSHTASVSTKTLFLFTGNNVRPIDDMARRTLTCRIDAGVENPYALKFDSDPLLDLRANRPHYLAAALAFLQAFIRSGRKPDMSPFGSFSEWSNMVRAALIDAGMADPVQAVAQNTEDDPARDAHGFIMATWFDAYGDRPVTTRTVINSHAPTWQRTGTELGYLLAEVAGERGSVDALKLGRWIGSKQEVPVNGMRFVMHKHANGSRFWKVVKT